MDNDPGRLTCSRWVAAAIVCAAVVSGLRGDEPPDGGQAPQAAAADADNKPPIDKNAGTPDRQAPAGGNPLQQLLNNSQIVT